MQAGDLPSMALSLGKWLLMIQMAQVLTAAARSLQRSLSKHPCFSTPSGPFIPIIFMSSALFLLSFHLSYFCYKSQDDILGIPTSGIPDPSHPSARD